MRKPEKVSVWAFLLFASQLWSCTASAQSRSRENLAELSKVSDVIVVAICRAVESQWNHDRSLIYTRFSFEVAQVVKGESELKTFDMRQLGGQVGPAAMRPSHPLGFKPGLSYMLFLSPPTNTSALISQQEKESGQWQEPRLMARANRGRFELAAEPETGKLYVVNPPAEAMPQTDKGYAQKLEDIPNENRLRKPALKSRLYLDEFVGSIKNLVR